jgi:hypothetical protein
MDEQPDAIALLMALGVFLVGIYFTLTFNPLCFIAGTAGAWFVLMCAAWLNE